MWMKFLYKVIKLRVNTEETLQFPNKKQQICYAT